MSFIRDLRELWGYQDRVAALESAARQKDYVYNDLARKAKRTAESLELAKAGRDEARAERDDLRRKLDESREDAKLLVEAVGLLGLTGLGVSEDLGAALELLDEAGEEIKRLNGFLRVVMRERDAYFDQVEAITAVVRR